MKEPKDGGPAFPATRVEANSPQVVEAFGLTHQSVDFPGMSLRDWFAGQALIGLAHGAAGATFSMSGLMSAADDRGVSVHQVMAEGSYALADAMLAARSKP